LAHRSLSRRDFGEKRALRNEPRAGFRSPDLTIGESRDDGMGVCIKARIGFGQKDTLAI
jgi:hypothetical protein